MIISYWYILNFDKIFLLILFFKFFWRNKIKWLDDEL